MKFNVELKEPAVCSSTELTMFRNLVVQGDEVDPHGLEGRIRNAKALAFGYFDNLLMGVAAVKCQNPNYRHHIFQQASISSLSAKYVHELGWIFVAPNYRQKGLSVELVQKLVKLYSAENIYSTSKTTNTPMHSTLIKFGFSAAGKTWHSKRGLYDLAMYLRPVPQPTSAADVPRVAN